MMTSGRTRLLLALLVAAISSGAATQESVGRVKTVRGEAFLVSGDERREAAVGADVFRRDTLQTGADGALGVTLLDGSRLSLGAESRLSVDEYLFTGAGDDDSSEVTLLRGTLSFVSGLIARLRPGAAKVKASEATLAIRGTHLLVRSVPEGTPPVAASLDFDDLDPGTVVSAAFARATGGEALGPVRVRGRNPHFEGGAEVNTAVAFDSSAPTPADRDLGTPNVDFDGPGAGRDGGRGRRFENSRPLGRVLIVSRTLKDRDGDGLVDRPDDESRPGTELIFDFAALGTVTVSRITVLDHEEPEGSVKLLGAGGEVLRQFALPDTGDNGVSALELGPTAGVASVEAQLAGSGALDELVFEAVPNSFVTLVEEPDGSVGSISVSDASGATELDGARRAVLLRPGFEHFEISAEQLMLAFRDALAAEPPAPEAAVLYFLLDSTELVPESNRRLRELAAKLREWPAPEIQIDGHADRAGDERRNDRLAASRAEAVRQALLAAGAAAEWIDVRSFGESRPAVPTADGVREERNRRVEVRIR